MRVSEQTDRLASSVVTPDRAVATLTDDVRAGLLSRPRWLPAKYFYDDHGSELFEAICATPEYYPSRAEEALLAAHAGSIVEAASPDHMLELGSGSSRKTRHLLAACDRLGRKAFEGSWKEGRTMTTARAIEHALQRRQEPESYTAGLTRREVEVLRLVADGLTDGQAAEQLHVSPRTVGNHLRSVYNKLGVPSRAAAARQAVERGLL